MNNALEALRGVDFDWVRSLESIWSDADTTVDGPNRVLVDSLVANFFRDTTSASAKPEGAVLIGQSGIGKTHLVGVLRRRVWQSGGWFVLLDVLGLTEFWRSAALSFLTSLLQEMPGGRRQFEMVLAGVARRFNVEKEVETAFNTPNIEPRRIVDLLVKGLMKVDMTNTLQHRDVFRALSLLRSTDLDTVSLAHSWLQGYDADEKARAALGFHAPPPQPVELVRGMSWIMSLAGPTLVAVDQIDGVVNPTNVGNDDVGGMQGLGGVLAAGLLQLHDVRHRGRTLISCLFDSWKVLEEQGLLPFLQRFDDPIAMQGMNDGSAIRSLIVSRLSPAYEKMRFTPTFPSWPFSEAAIDTAASVGMMPRTILMRCDAFRRKCLEQANVKICDSLIETPKSKPEPVAKSGYTSELRRLAEVSDIAGLIKSGDDSEFGRLLREVVDIYALQINPDETIDVVSKGDPVQKIPPLHARLTFTYHKQNDRERHFCFRALEHSHHIAFQARLRAALTASGISNQIPDRHLLLVRRSPIPSGTKTKQLFEAFKKAGGFVINPLDKELRMFVALVAMRNQAAMDGKQGAFDTWLKTEKPLDATTFFKEAGLSPELVTPLGAAGRQEAKGQDTASSEQQKKEQATEVAAPQHSATGASSPAPVVSIPVGRRMALGEEQVRLPTKLLRRHTAIIAGSGSGKTVLLRRIVEEAALAGIPSIVIDPNNDLSRLGDPWPERPGSFTPEDDAKAERYFSTVEVVVWTPGIHAGNPLFLSVLPDFGSLGDDKDERQQAVDMAAETLGPLAGAKNALQRGVLVEALRHFASGGGGDLGSFTALLTDLPEGLSPIGNASKIAAGMANQLYAAVATNPLLRADGPTLDPKALFFGPDPTRLRLSVINMSGLVSDAAREDFVNRLQMTLFSWIKKNPSTNGLLYVIDEAQTFLPSQKPAISLGSGIKLVAQARKYGLGMIVATQAPRGIHNHVVQNCTTQFFGKQNAPATIGAAQEIIAASGGKADDLGKLRAGEFYFATDGSGKPGKVRTPICLSFHPPNPPPPEEVIALAKAKRTRASPGSYRRADPSVRL